MGGWRTVLLCVFVAVAAGCSGARDEGSSSVPPTTQVDASQANAATDVVTEPVDSTTVPAGGAARPDDWPTAGAEPPEEAPATYGAPFGEAAEPPSGEESEPPTRTAAPRIATAEAPKEDHVVRVFYATDRAPADLSAESPVTWRHYLPTIATAAVTLLAGLGVVFLPRKVLSVALLMGGLGGTLYFGQSAMIRAQQLRRAAEYGDRAYGSGRHEADGRPVLELGVCEVSIPPDHRVGRVESPSVLRLEFREDPERHVVLERVVRLPDGEFYDALRETVEGSSAKQAFVFVHGYNVGFDAAVKRTAQIAHDLRFDGAAVCYSWPSHAGLARYTQDEANVAWTVTQLEGFLRDVAGRTGARTVHLVAHSMGNRALVQAVERLALRGDGPTFGQVVLAAPDVDAGEFRTRYAPALAQVARRTTLYASSNDRALLASTRVHGYTRAGLSGGHLVVVPGLDTIDVSPIDTSLIGHSYYGDNPLMIRDLVAVIHGGLPADGRDWLRRTLVTPEAFYWAFRPELTAERF